MQLINVINMHYSAPSDHRELTGISWSTLLSNKAKDKIKVSTQSPP